jgi:TIR domain-containing protein
VSDIFLSYAHEDRRRVLRLHPPLTRAPPSPARRGKRRRAGATLGEATHMPRVDDRPIEVFYSYSHRDEEYRKKLGDHLSVLRRDGSITDWHDRDIDAGTAWQEEIDRHLLSADIVLLLVSASFIASDYCWGDEMTKALARHRDGKTRVIPVILHPCGWLRTPLSVLQGVPRDNRAISLWPNEHAAFDHVVSEITKVVDDLRRRRTAESKFVEEDKPPIGRSQRFWLLLGRRPWLFCAASLLAGLVTAAGVLMMPDLTPKPHGDKRMVIAVPGGKTIAEYPPQPGCLYEVHVDKQGGALQACFTFNPADCKGAWVTDRTAGGAALKAGVPVYVSLGDHWAAGTLKAVNAGKYCVELDTKLACRGAQPELCVGPDAVIAR